MFWWTKLMSQDACVCHHSGRMTAFIYKHVISPVSKISPRTGLIPFTGAPNCLLSKTFSQWSQKTEPGHSCGDNDNNSVNLCWMIYILSELKKRHNGNTRNTFSSLISSVSLLSWYNRWKLDRSTSWGDINQTDTSFVNISSGHLKCGYVIPSFNFIFAAASLFNTSTFS